MADIPQNLPSTKPDQRREIYKPIEDLILTGFQSRPLVINSIPAALRTPLPSDLAFIKSYGPKLPIKRSKQLLVARCIWRVGDQIVLNSPEVFPKILEMVTAIPKNVLDILYIVISNMLNTAVSMYDGVEPYSYEYYSRYFWKSLRGLLPCEDAFTGLPGTSLLGMNNIQRAWVFFNTLEDSRNDELSSWTSSKFIASAMVGKGIEKINNADQRSRKKDEEYRQGLRDAYYYYRIKVISYESFKSVISGVGLEDNAHADLEEEMRKVIEGEKDEHDIVIEMAERKMLEDSFPKISNKEILVSDEVLKNTKIVGYTPEQLKHLSKTAPQSQKSIMDIDPKQHYFLTKFIKPEVRAGKIVIDGDNIRVDSETDNSSNNQPLVEEPMSLDQLLQSRKIVLG
jgi:hypothetical protein